MANNTIEILVGADEIAVKSKLEKDLKNIASQISKDDNNRPKVAFGLDIAQTKKLIEKDLQNLLKTLKVGDITINSAKVASGGNSASAIRQYSNVAELKQTNRMYSNDRSKADPIEDIKRQLLASGNNKAVTINGETFFDTKNHQQLKSFTATVTKSNGEIEKMSFSLAKVNKTYRLVQDDFNSFKVPSNDAQVTKTLEKFKANKYDKTFNSIKNIDITGMEKVDIAEYNNDLMTLNQSYTNLSKIVQTLDLSQPISKDVIDEVETFTKTYDKLNATLVKTQNIKNNNMGVTKGEKAQADILLTLSRFEQNNGAFRKNAGLSSWFDDLVEKANNLPRDMNGAFSQIDTDNLRTEIEKFSKVTVQAGLNTQSFGQRLKGQVEKLGVYVSGAAVIMGAMAQIRKMITTVRELDAQLVDIQMVTGNTREETQQLMNTYSEMGKTLGATTAQVAASANEWLRQGMSIEETNLAIEKTIQLSKISGMTTEETTQRLTSAMKGYKLSVEDLESINDKVSKVDMISATSASGLMEGMARVANSANDAGYSMDRLLATLATIGEVTQRDMSTVGDSLRTIFARMSNIKIGKLIDDEDGSSLSDVETTLNHVGIQLRKDNNTFRDYGDVLDDIYAKWDKLSDVDQNAIGSALGGARRIEDVRVLFANYENIQKYTEASQNSAGSSMEKYNAYTQGIESSINQFISSFEKLSQTMMGSDLFKGIVDGGTVALDVLSGIVSFLDDINALLPVIASSILSISGNSILPTLFTAEQKTNLTAYMTAIDNNMEKHEAWNKYIQGSGKSVEVAANKYKKGTQSVKGLGSAFNIVGIKAKASAIGVGLLNAALNMGVMYLATGAITLLTKLFDNIAHKAENAKESLKEFSDNCKEQSDSVLENEKSIASLSEEYEKLAKGVDNNGKNIGLTTDEFARYNDITKQIADMFPDMVQGWDAQGNAILKNKGNVDELTKALEAQKKAAYENTLVTAKQDNIWENYQTATQPILENLKSAKLIVDNLNNPETLSNMYYQDSAIFDEKTLGGINEYLRTLGLYNANYTTTDSTLTGEYAAKDLQENSSLIISGYNELVRKINAETNKIRPVVSALLNTDYDYLSLDTESQDLVSQITSGFDSDFFQQFDNEDDMYAWIQDNIIAPLLDTKTSEKTKEALEKLLSPPEGMSKEGYERYIHQWLSQLPQDLQNNLRNSGIIPEWVAQEAKTTGAEIESAFAQIDLEIYDFDKLSSQIDKIQTAYKEASNAINEYNSTGKLTIDSLQSILSASEGYLGYLLNEEGQLDLTTGSMEKLTRAKIIDMGVSQATALVNQVNNAINEKDTFKRIVQLDALAGKNYEYAESLWEVNKEELRRLYIAGDINEIQYASYVRQVEAIKSMTYAAADNVDLLGDSVDGTSDKINKASQQMRDDQAAINDLLAMTIAMIKKEQELKKEAYQEEIDKLTEIRDLELERYEEKLEHDNEIIDKAKEKIQAEKDYYDYQKSLTEKKDDISDINNQLKDLQYDDSLEAQELRLELMDELKEKQEELDDFQYEHSVETRLDELDEKKEINQKEYDNKVEILNKEYEAEVKILDDKIKAIEDYLDQEGTIRNDAIALIEGKTKAFYDRLMKWNIIWGDGLRSTVELAWADCYAAMDRYNTGMYNVLDTLNKLAYKLHDLKDSSNDLANSLDKISNFKQEEIKLDAVYVVVDKDGNIKSQPTTNRQSLYTYFEGAYNAERTVGWSIKKLHTGGMVDGNVPDKYKELFNLANDEIPAILQKGEAVLTKNHLDSLTKNISTISNMSSSPSIIIGDINITGNADSNTVAQLNNIRKQIASDVAREFNSKQKSRGFNLNRI